MSQRDTSSTEGRTLTPDISLGILGKVLMVDGSKVLTAQRAQNILSDDDVNRLYQFYLDYQTVEDYSAVVTLENIAAKDYDLSPNKYVSYHKEEIKPYSEVKAAFQQAYLRMVEAEQKFRNVMKEEMA